jgi:hypothetical protein
MFWVGRNATLPSRATHASLLSTIRVTLMAAACTRPSPSPAPPLEVAFLQLGQGAERWLVEAAAAGTARVRTKMAQAVELARALDAERIDQALGLAAIAGRFDDGDLTSILDHLATAGQPDDVVIADQAHSVQPGTGGWERLGRLDR